MKKIFKYAINIVDEQTVEMPVGAKVLAVQTQPTMISSGAPMLWALVSPDQPMEKRKVHVLGTGHPADRVKVEWYVGTFQVYGGQLVFHVFVEPNV